MSTIVNQLDLNTILPLTLAQCITSNQSHSLPLLVQLSDNHLILDSNIELSPQLTNIENLTIESADVTSSLELIVFSNITLKQLELLTSTCHVTIQHLNAINHRNQSISYRFSVTCENLNEARKRLCLFNQEQQLESALIEQAPKLNQPGLLVMDMDSTTIKIECIDEIAKLAGVGEQVSAVTELAMQGQLDFTESLYQRVATLANCPEKVLQQIAQTIPLMEGLESLVKQLKQYHWRIAIASGGFTYFAEHLQKLLNLDKTFANQLEIVEGKLTGKVLGKVIDAQAKAESLEELAKLYQLKENQTVAMGDGANDLTMMSAAALGVAFHAKPIVLEQADATINQQGLDCLLHWLA